MSFVNIWRRGFLSAPVADAFEYFRTIWEPGNVQRQSLKLPYAGGYRTNVCRRRLASDLARASETRLPPQGVSRGSP